MVLPDETRAALLAASALSQPTLALVAERQAGTGARLAPALAAHVIELDGERIRFSHPLLASGIYAEAGSAERRALHRRLAELVPDPEESARHLALGAEGPAEDVAAALGHEARASTSPRCLRGRGRAVRAGPAADARGDGGKPAPADCRGCGLCLGGRRSERARELFSEARVTAQPGPRRGEILYWLGSIQEYEGDRREAVELYREARSNAGDDVALRARAEEGLASALFLLRSDLSAAADHARAAVGLAEQAGDPGMEIAASQRARRWLTR